MFNFNIKSISDLLDCTSRPYWQLVRFQDGSMAYCEDGQCMVLPAKPSNAMGHKWKAGRKSAIPSCRTCRRAKCTCFVSRFNAAQMEAHGWASTL